MGEVAPLRAILNAVERRSFHSRRQAIKSDAVEQRQVERCYRIVVRMPHRSAIDAMGDVVPHAVAFDADSYGVSTRRLVYGDTWHEGADASRRHRWNE